MNFSSSKCICEDGWTSKDCSEKTCSSNGILSIMNNSNKKKCNCFPGFYGEKCQFKECPYNCSDHGKCNEEGVCECFNGFSGEVNFFFLKLFL